MNSSFLLLFALLLLLLLSFILIKFDIPREAVQAVIKSFENHDDYLRSTISRISDDQDVKCECLEEGKFIKDQVNYMKPMSTNNKRKIYRDYGVRL